MGVGEAIHHMSGIITLLLGVCDAHQRATTEYWVSIVLSSVVTGEANFTMETTSLTVVEHTDT